MCGHSSVKMVFQQQISKNQAEDRQACHLPFSWSLEKDCLSLKCLWAEKLHSLLQFYYANLDYSLTYFHCNEVRNEGLIGARPVVFHNTVSHSSFPFYCWVRISYVAQANTKSLELTILLLQSPGQPALQTWVFESANFDFILKTKYYYRLMVFFHLAFVIFLMKKLLKINWHFYASCTDFKTEVLRMHTLPKYTMY